MRENNKNKRGEKNYCNQELKTAGRDLEKGVDSKPQNQLFDNQFAREPRASSELVRWLTTDEAAQYLRVSISSLKTMIFRGRVRAHKLGRRNRFLREELER